VKGGRGEKCEKKIEALEENTKVREGKKTTEIHEDAHFRNNWKKEEGDHLTCCSSNKGTGKVAVRWITRGITREGRLALDEPGNPFPLGLKNGNVFMLMILLKGGGEKRGEQGVWNKRGVGVPWIPSLEPVT